MNYKEFLRTCQKKDGSLLSDRTVEHYTYGLKIVSEDMLREGVITKPLMDMDSIELDLAIALIYKNPFFKNKDKVGKRMYSNALKHYRLFVMAIIGERNPKTEIEKVEEDTKLTITEKETIIKARVGQGLYREKLLRKYNSRCIITNINMPALLVASHIKPWAASTNFERISEDNGFLLSSTYDRLFDQGFISFQDDGRLLVSSMISNDNAKILELDKSKKYDIKFVPSMEEFMQYHRDTIFLN